MKDGQLSLPPNQQLNIRLVGRLPVGRLQVGNVLQIGCGQQASVMVGQHSLPLALQVVVDIGAVGLMKLFPCAGYVMEWMIVNLGMMRWTVNEATRFVPDWRTSPEYPTFIPDETIEYYFHLISHYIWGFYVKMFKMY